MPETIGDHLRQARETKGWSIEDVSHETKIPVSTLRSLEGDDYSSFSSATYAKSFLTLYSRHLDLDTEPTVESFLAADLVDDVSEQRHIQTVTRPAGSGGQASRSRGSSLGSADSEGSPSNLPTLLFGLVVVGLVITVPVLIYLGQEEKKKGPGGEGPPPVLPTPIPAPAPASESSDDDDPATSSSRLPDDGTLVRRVGPSETGAEAATPEPDGEADNPSRPPVSAQPVRAQPVSAGTDDEDASESEPSSEPTEATADTGDRASGAEGTN